MLGRVFKIALPAVVVLIFFLSAWVAHEFTTPSSPSPGEVIFEIKPGQSARAIAQHLRDRGLIRKTWVFLLGHKLVFGSQPMKAGEYAVDLPASSKEILSMITEGRILLHAVTIPEGLTRRETADHLRSQMGLDADIYLQESSKADLIAALDESATSLEGYLFPETYHFPKGATPEQVVRTMVTQFETVFNEEWRQRAAEIGMTVRDVVILASLIESETSLPSERPLVSAVFHNRLKKGMKLDCDPTIIYVLKNAGTFRDRLRTKDLRLDSPYNTYLYPGLPPGPIANPGRDALRAALYPADADYLYFVAKNDGSHHFSSNFTDHQNAVNKYQRVIR